VLREFRRARPSLVEDDATSRGTRQYQQSKTGIALAQKCPRVSVILPTLNVEGTIEQCLTSLLEQTYPAHLVEVIVVDGGSIDKTTNLAARFPVTFVKLPGNAPKAMNYGSRLATGTIVLFADGDAYYARDWIEEHVSNLADPRVVASGGPCFMWKKGGYLSQLIGYELESRYSRLPRTVTRLATMNLAVRKELLEEVGGFAETLDVAYDTEFGYRLAEHGLRITVTNLAVAYHANRATLSGYLRQQYRYARFSPVIFGLHPRAIRGDSVTSFWMNIQPVALVAMLVTSGIGFLSPALWSLSAALAFFLGITIAGETVPILLSSRSFVALLAPLPLLARIFAWAFGGFAFIAIFAKRRLRTGT